MKIILGLSLLLNLVLVGVLLNRSPEVVSSPETIEDEKNFPLPVAEVMMGEKKKEVFPKKAPTSTAEIQNDGPMDLDTYELNLSAEKVEQDAAEFVTVQLQLPEETYLKHQKLREDFHVKMANIWGNPPREPDIQGKRQLLDIEEKYMEELEKLYGKKNWEKLQEFRQKYNQEGFKRQSEEKVPFIFMSL